MEEKDKELVISNLSENLPVLRAKLNMTQEELAKKLGVTRQTIINIESRKSKISWSLVVAILLLFIVNPLTSGLVFGLGIVNKNIIDYLGLGSIVNVLKNLSEKRGE